MVMLHGHHASARTGPRFRSECLGQSWKARVGQFWRAPKFRRRYPHSCGHSCSLVAAPEGSDHTSSCGPRAALSCSPQPQPPPADSTTAIQTQFPDQRPTSECPVIRREVVELLPRSGLNRLICARSNAAPRRITQDHAGPFCTMKVRTARGSCDN